MSSPHPPTGSEPGSADEAPDRPDKAPGDGTDDGDALKPASSPPARLGTTTFTIEGRAAPALFVVGWLATIAGVALIGVAIMSADSSASRVLVVVGMMALAVGLIAGAGSQGIERRARGRLPYLGPSPFLVLLASVPISILGLVLVSVPLGLLGIPLDGPFAALVSVSVQAFVYVGLVRLLVVDTAALSWAEMGIGRLDGRAFLEMAGGALWALPVILVTGILASALVRLVPVEPVSPLPPTGTAIGFALSLCAGAIVAPVGEEILFRGFATTAWARGMGIARGLIVGALVFAFAHVITVSGSSAGDAFGQAFVAFVGRLPVALALGWLFLRRGTIWASFGLHATFNAVLLVLAEVAARST